MFLLERTDWLIRMNRCLRFWPHPKYLTLRRKSPSPKIQRLSPQAVRKRDTYNFHEEELAIFGFPRSPCSFAPSIASTAGPETSIAHSLWVLKRLQMKCTDFFGNPNSKMQNLANSHLEEWFALQKISSVSVKNDSLISRWYLYRTHSALCFHFISAACLTTLITKRQDSCDKNWRGNHSVVLST